MVDPCEPFADLDIRMDDAQKDSLENLMFGLAFCQVTKIKHLKYREFYCLDDRGSLHS